MYFRRKITVQIEECRAQIGTYYRATSGRFAKESTSRDDAVSEIVRLVKSQGDCDDTTYIDLREVA